MKRFCLALAFSSTVHAWAADPDCLQENAVYGNVEGPYSLRFTNPKSGSGIASNTFEITIERSKEKLSGWVIWNDGVSRPMGIVTHDCPSGDITGEELDACKVWEGVVYSIWDNGEADLLPPAGEKATYSVLLPNFGRVLRNSKAWQKAGLQTVPWDAFTFKTCEAD